MTKHFLLWPCLLLCTALTPSFSQNENLQLLSTVDFPNDASLANVCGYWQNGREYALVGASRGMTVVDITDPQAPVTIVQIPGPNNLWKEIKVYKHYAYVTTEGGGGLQIVDLSPLPSSNLPFKSYTGDGAIAGQLSDIHALHIDTTAGYVYLFGGGLFGGAAKVLSLADPFNPQYAGRTAQFGYIHDGYADNDTLYACHIEVGILAIYDMHDKSNPKLLGSVETPGKFTHNAWLFNDRKHIVTTDEKEPSFVTAYDVSDPEDIRELDRVAVGNGFGSIGHNTHVINNWTVTSWYTDGLTIVDITRPENIVQVGRYDTWPGGNFDLFQGCWGVFPYFPSGTIIASNIEPAELFIFKPTYERACYLEGTIFNGCNNLPLEAATVTILSDDKNAFDESNILGVYKAGLLKPGTYNVSIERPGYISQIKSVVLETAKVTTLDVTLEAQQNTNVRGLVVDKITGQPVPGVLITVDGLLSDYSSATDAGGNFEIACIPADDYIIITDQWGYLQTETPATNTKALIQLEKGYYDAFANDLGWTSGGSATSGKWQLGEPEKIMTSDNPNSAVTCPDNDAISDNNDRCYITGNGGGNGGSNDVDNGDVIVTSPFMHLKGYTDAELSFDYWFYNGGGIGNPPPPVNDKFLAKIKTPKQEATIFTQNQSASSWRASGLLHLKDFVQLTDSMQIQFITADDAPGHLVEALVDVFKLVPTGFVSKTRQPETGPAADISPNPSALDFTLRTAAGNRVEVFDPLGRLLNAFTMSETQFRLGSDWNPGLYLISVSDETGRRKMIKAVKSGK